MTQSIKQRTQFEQLLDVLCPWYLVVDAEGRICCTGHSVLRLNDGNSLVGGYLLDFLELRRPHALSSIKGLMDQTGRKLHFKLRQPPHTELKGVMAPLPDGLFPEVTRGGVLTLSFGISVVDAVRDFALTGKDFAVTDLTVEMLYLVEAKSSVMQELRHLNTRLEHARTEAEEQAVTDLLTGLGNRRAMDHALGQVLSKKAGFAMMHIDLDHFKQVNDTHGHAAGDVVLQDVANRLRAATRIEDTVVRQGGDEFIVLLPGIIEETKVSNLAQRLVTEIEKPIPFGEHTLQVSASIGISIATDLAKADPDVMMEEADAALYEVKEHGRHGFRIYTPEMRRKAGDESVA